MSAQSPRRNPEPSRFVSVTARYAAAGTAPAASFSSVRPWSPRSCTGFGAKTRPLPSVEPDPGFVANAAEAVTSDSTATTSTIRFTASPLSDGRTAVRTCGAYPLALRSKRLPEDVLRRPPIPRESLCRDPGHLRAVRAGRRRAGERHPPRGRWSCRARVHLVVPVERDGHRGGPEALARAVHDGDVHVQLLPGDAVADGGHADRRGRLDG